MSVKDGKDYLYLVWKCDSTRRQYIVGQLTKNGQYEFRYCGEIAAAIEAGFTQLVSFSDLEQLYTSKELFPVFASRLPDRKRKDIERILRKYGLEEYDSYQLLKKSGARLPIDNLQFIDPILNFENAFEKVFYLAGVRHYLGCEGVQCPRSIPVDENEELLLEREESNPYDKNAIRVLNYRKKLLGYIPRFYSEAFIRFMDEGRFLGCHVVSVNKEQNCDECINVCVRISACQ